MSNKVISLTPEELYFLGVKINAKYVDYAYISAVKPLDDDVSIEQEIVKNALIEKGYLEEDFSGNIIVSQDVISSITPIFFGEKEYILIEQKTDDSMEQKVYRFHFFENVIVKVLEGVSTYKIEIISKEKFDEFLRESFMNQTDIIPGSNDLEYDSIDEVILLTIMHLGCNNTSFEFGKHAGNTYVECDSGKLQAISNEDIDKVIEVLVEDENVI